MELKSSRGDKNQSIWHTERFYVHGTMLGVLWHFLLLQSKIWVHGFLASSSPQVLPSSWNIPRSMRPPTNVLTSQFLSLLISNDCLISPTLPTTYVIHKGCVINNCSTSEILKLDIWIPASPFLHNLYSMQSQVPKITCPAPFTLLLYSMQSL